MAELTVRYFAAARAAAGVPQERLTLADDAKLDDVLATLAERHPGKLTAVLAASTILIDGVAAGSSNQSLNGATELDVLPPFAGG
jgi:sulfur-carrier protein